MRRLVVRQRYVYPSADLVTGNPAIDRALHGLSAAVRRDAHGLGISALDPDRSVVVLGFPRSGNTTLTAWLQRFARPGVTVVDGRQTHSALDVMRCVDHGIAVMIPARNAVDTCASMMLRAGQHESPDYGRAILGAYAAWYRTASRALASPHVSVAPFHHIARDPWDAAAWSRVIGLVDTEAAAAVPVEAFLRELRDDLAGEPVQGQPQYGVPSAHMISLPTPERRAVSARTKALLRSAVLDEARGQAESAFARFMSIAEGSCRVHARHGMREHGSPTAFQPLGLRRAG